MKAWMLPIADLVRTWVSRQLAATPSRSLRSRDSRSMLGRGRSWAAGPTRCEGLEGRALLAASGVSPFAILPGQVTSTNQPSQVVLHLNAGELRADQSSTVVVGFLVEAANGSAISPEITQATGPNGPITPLSIPNRGNSALDKAARQTHLFTRVIPLANQSQDITLNVATLNKKTGNYIVEAFLAGDVNGDGSVDSNDLNALQVAYGSNSGQANYNAAADINGDGRVGCIDRSLTTDNLGAHVTATGSASPATASPIVQLASASTEVSLVPQSAPTVVATPVAIATPVVAAPATVAATSYVPVAATSTTAPVILTPVYNTSGTITGYVANSSLVNNTAAGNGYTAAGNGYTVAGNGYTVAGNGYVAAPSGTPVNYYGQPTGTIGTTATPTSSAPVYLYGQPVVGGASSNYSNNYSPASTLFGQTTSNATTATVNTPVPVYLYNTPNYAPLNYSPVVTTGLTTARSVA